MKEYGGEEYSKTAIEIFLNPWKTLDFKGPRLIWSRTWTDGI